MIQKDGENNIVVLFSKLKTDIDIIKMRVISIKNDILLSKD